MQKVEQQVLDNRGEAADAFTQDWRGDNNWLVPPLKDIPKVLMYLKEQNARGTILVPLWKQWWWPLVMRMATDWMVLGQRGPEIFQRGESGSIEPLHKAAGFPSPVQDKVVEWVKRGIEKCTRRREKVKLFEVEWLRK
jgi:hypothetical protein